MKTTVATNSMLALALLALMAASAAPAQSPGGQPGSQPNGQSGKGPAASPSPPMLPSLDPSSDTFPADLEASQERLRNADRQKQLVLDTQKLLALANELKSDVDKSTKDTLSLDVIRKADEIEKLAHSVKERMKGE